MRIKTALWWFLSAAVTLSVPAALADPSTPDAVWNADAARPPYEVVRDHVEIIVQADGTFVEQREEIYRPLSVAGVKLLQQRQLAYTRGYERLEIVSAATVKADGRRIELPAQAIVSGFGQSSLRSFFGNDIISLSYPELEPGDMVVLHSRLVQMTPWFADTFDFRTVFSRTVRSHDVIYKLKAPAGMALHIDAAGLAGGAIESTDGAQRWIWQFDNDTPEPLAADSVSEADFAPHLNVSSFAGYADVAHAYRERARGRAAVTREIATLAASLTQKATDKREEARLIYEWVSTHIAFVAIELGAGGFTPHQAHDVLDNRFGDCKDHVVLLEAMLAARGIESSAALINSGAGSYRLPEVASAHAFDHVVTYLPGFDLFLDPSDGLTPFGELPYGDIDKPVVLAASGKVMRTPLITGSARIRVESVAVVDGDGVANGHSQVVASGAYGVHLRMLMQASGADRQDRQIEWLRLLIGPQAKGHIDHGVPLALQDPYAITADFRMPVPSVLRDGANWPSALSFRPFSFSELIGNPLPESRSNDYVCPSVSAAERMTLSLPDSSDFSGLPQETDLRVPEIHLQVRYRRLGPHSAERFTALDIAHPSARCTPAYFDRVRMGLAKMADALDPAHSVQLVQLQGSNP